MSLKPPEVVGHIKIEGKIKTLYMGSYTNNKRIALFLVSDNGEPFANISRNIDNLELDGDEFFVGWYDLNPQIMKDLIESPYFEDTGKFAVGGDVKMPVWRLCPLMGIVEGEE